MKIITCDVQQAIYKATTQQTNKQLTSAALDTMDDSVSNACRQAIITLYKTIHPVSHSAWPSSSEATIQWDI